MSHRLSARIIQEPILIGGITAGKEYDVELPENSLLHVKAAYRLADNDRFCFQNSFQCLRWFFCGSARLGINVEQGQSNLDRLLLGGRGRLDQRAQERLLFLGKIGCFAATHQDNRAKQQG